MSKAIKNKLSNCSEAELLKMLDAGEFDLDLQDRIDNFFTASILAPKSFVIAYINRYKDIDINVKSARKENILFECAYTNKFDLCKYFLENGADYNVRNDANNTALIISVFLSNREIAKELVRYGADVNHQGDNGDTALIKAVKQKDVEMVEFLLKNNADINIANNCNMGPLYHAVKYPDFQIISVLLKYNPDPNIVNNINHMNVIYMAKNSNNDDLNKMISEYATKFNKLKIFREAFEKEMLVVSNGKRAIKTAKIPKIKNAKKI